MPTSQHPDSGSETHTWTATHSAWFLFCPILIANIEDDAPVPMPRWAWLEWWLEFNYWLNGGLQWCIWLIAPNAVGYMFYAVRELQQPIQRTYQSR